MSDSRKDDFSTLNDLLAKAMDESKEVTDKLTEMKKILLRAKSYIDKGSSQQTTPGSDGFFDKSLPRNSESIDSGKSPDEPKSRYGKNSGE